ncbi:MAG TPA: hypothetical protein VE093_38145 [Polyangiaceae bacterium]|nr:hypothetical protein [Polyangiaceae bacterium]
MRPEPSDHPAELASAYIAERVRRASGRRWLQGRRAAPLPCDHPSPSIRLFAEHRLRRLPEAVPRALVAWAQGERRVDLLFHVPSARDVLALQARGRRCVSLLDDGVITAPHEDGLAFAVHDLCHLEKFADPAQHAAQVGFFAAVERSLDDPRVQSLDTSLDARWADDRGYVIADMNGSAVFLFLALKSKLKIAVRRTLAGAAMTAEAAASPLRPEEQRAYNDAVDGLLAALGLEGPAADAARALTTRGSAPGAEVTLYRFFHAAGQAVLARQMPDQSPP